MRRCCNLLSPVLSAQHTTRPDRSHTTGTNTSALQGAAEAQGCSVHLPNQQRGSKGNVLHETRQGRALSQHCSLFVLCLS